MKSLTKLAVVVALVVATVTPFAAKADLIATNGPHVTWNSIPFNNEGRYQQLYDAELFLSPVSLFSVAFAAGDSDFSGDVSIRLGLTEADSASERARQMAAAAKEEPFGASPAADAATQTARTIPPEK